MGIYSVALWKIGLPGQVRGDKIIELKVPVLIAPLSAVMTRSGIVPLAKGIQ